MTDNSGNDGLKSPSMNSETLSKPRVEFEGFNRAQPQRLSKFFCLLGIGELDIKYSYPKLALKEPNGKEDEITKNICKLIKDIEASMLDIIMLARLKKNNMNRNFINALFSIVSNKFREFMAHCMNRESIEIWKRGHQMELFLALIKLYKNILAQLKEIESDPRSTMHVGDPIASVTGNIIILYNLLAKCEFSANNTLSGIRYSQICMEWLGKLDFTHVQFSFGFNQDYTGPVLDKSFNTYRNYYKGIHLLLWGANLVQQGSYQRGLTNILRGVNLIPYDESSIFVILEEAAKKLHAENQIRLALQMYCILYEFMRTNINILTPQGVLLRKPIDERCRNKIQELKQIRKTELELLLIGVGAPLFKDLSLEYEIKDQNMIVKGPSNSSHLKAIYSFLTSRNVEVRQEKNDIIISGYVQVDIESLIQLLKRYLHNLKQNNEENKSVPQVISQQPSISLENVQDKMTNLALEDITRDLGNSSSKGSELKSEEVKSLGETETVEQKVPQESYEKLTDNAPPKKKKRQQEPRAKIAHETVKRQQKNVNNNNKSPQPIIQKLVQTAKEVGFSSPQYQDAKVVKLQDPNGGMLGDADIYAVLDINSRPIPESMSPYLKHYQEIFERGVIGSKGESCIRPVTPKEAKGVHTLWKIAPKGKRNARIWGHKVDESVIPIEEGAKKIYLVAFDEIVETHKGKSKKGAKI